MRFLALVCGFLLGLAAKLSVVECSDIGSDSSSLDADSGSLSNARVSVYTGHDDLNCSTASTVVIQEGGCDGWNLFRCTPFTVGAGTTYYGQGTCSDSREGYLQSTFGDVGLFVVEYYEDSDCSTLHRSDVYLADSKCHYFTLGVMQIWTAEDKSMAALTVNSACDKIDWSVFMELNVSVNTGECVADGDNSTDKGLKYLLLGEPVYFDPFAAKLATDANTSTTTTTTTSTSAPTPTPTASTATSFFTMNIFMILLMATMAIAATN